MGQGYTQARYSAPKSPLSRAHAVLTVEGNTQHGDARRAVPRRGGVSGPVHVWKLQTREPGDPMGVRQGARPARRQAERSENVTGATADMNAHRKSDESVVPATSTNNDAAEASAESIEERDSAKRNALQPASLRTLGRDQGKSCGLHGVREVAISRLTRGKSRMR